MKYILITFLMLINICAFGQRRDSVVYYDVVYLADGKGWLKGNIISYDEEDGDIQFKDLKGNEYFLKSEDYVSFKRDVEFKTKSKTKKAPLELRPRKENEFEISAGLAINYLSISAPVQPADPNYIGNANRVYVPSLLGVQFGKYFNRSHYFGVVAEIPLVSTAKVFNAGLRYHFQYDQVKNNLGLYIPVRIDYNYMNIPALPFDPRSSYSTEHSLSLGTALNSVGVGIGHGFLFMLKNKHSIALEAAVNKFFVLGHEFVETNGYETPLVDFSLIGVHVQVKFNF